MRLLLDTHILLWSIIEPDRLSAATSARLQDGSNTILFSTASVWERLVTQLERRNAA